ncbi:hypothetical protein, partial [Merismopedia glauca]
PGEEYRVVQHRFGWREGDGQDSTFRFGKGTLRPQHLSNLSYADPNNEPKIDLILPLSSFKGTDKDNPNGATKPQIKPGLYTQQIWLGEKALSQKGKTAISQVIPSFPGGMKDYLEELESRASKLSEIQHDPREVAKLYCQKYEERKESQKSGVRSQELRGKEEEVVELESTDSEVESEEREDPRMYQLIKADVEGGHFQLVEMEKVRRELAKFIQKQWKEIATGYSLTFDRATIIPSKDLKNGEICVPWMEEGEKVLNFRAPFLNSNGMCLSVNKLVSDRLSPDGSDLEGVIVVNDETLEQINQRIEALKAQGIETDEIVPLQTESERQARDFDGDTLGVALARDWTNLALEVESRNLKEFAYAPTVKLPKQSFYNPDGSQPPFEEIAHFMSDSMPVGVTNNQVVGFVCLSSEIEILKTHGTKEQKLGYVLTVADHYRRLIEQAKDTESPKPLDPNYQKIIQDFIKLSLDPKNIDSALELNRQFYRQLIEAACFENQVAVDMFKSARAPDMELIAENRRYMYRDVNYIKDKKSPTAYLDRTIEPTGYSPVEVIINQTNQYYQESSLQSREISQFDQLFEGVEYSNQQKLAATQVKQDFDQVMVEAIRLDKRRQSDVGPSATFISTKGVEIEITNLVKSDFPDIWKSTGKQFNIHLKPNQTGTHHQLVAYAKLEGQQEYLPLGTLSVDFIRELKLQPGMVTTAKLTSFTPEISQDQVQALFKSAYLIANDFRQSIPPEQLPAMAAAAWAVSTTREAEERQG